jgi:hypothetical protein
MALPLIIGEEQKEALAALRELAAKHPVNMVGLTEKIKDPACRRAHMDQMNRQTVVFPLGFMVTFSIETGHPVGTCRHMSMSSPAKGRVPSPEAVNMIAELLGFVGGYELCSVWMEDLQRGEDRAQAVNLVQPLTVVAGSATQDRKGEP